MLFIIVGLIVLSVVFYMRGTVATNSLEESQIVAQNTINVIKKLDYNNVYPQCKYLRPSRLDILQNCLDAINHNLVQEEMFKQDDFHNADVKKNESGYLIVNYYKGAEKLESRKFILEHNHKVVDTGCTTPGFIERGYTCRLEFPDECLPGDNLEIKYENTRVYLKTC